MSCLGWSRWTPKAVASPRKSCVPTCRGNGPYWCAPPWVDVADGAGAYGLALISDHTTSYAHGPTFPLGLTLQYAGQGLWGRDYGAEGPTEVRYALLLHAGRWDAAGVSTAAASWQEPAIGAFARDGDPGSRSLIDPGESGDSAFARFESDDHPLDSSWILAGRGIPAEPRPWCGNTDRTLTKCPHHDQPLGGDASPYRTRSYRGNTPSREKHV